jgi:hypothetical protein
MKPDGNENREDAHRVITKTERYPMQSKSTIAKQWGGGKDGDSKLTLTFIKGHMSLLLVAADPVSAHCKTTHPGKEPLHKQTCSDKVPPCEPPQTSKVLHRYCTPVVETVKNDSDDEDANLP